MTSEACGEDFRVPGKGRRIANLLSTNLARRVAAPRSARRADNCGGAVTAEFAVVLPAVLLLLALLLTGSAAGITQLRLEEAARAGARALARGEGAGAVDGIVRKLAGASASVAVVADAEWLSVTVSDRVSGPFGSAVPWTLTARASARGEASASTLPPLATSGIETVPGSRTASGSYIRRAAA